MQILRIRTPNYVLILHWNLRDGIMKQMLYIGQLGGRFIVTIPEVRIHAAKRGETCNITWNKGRHMNESCLGLRWPGIETLSQN